MTTKETALALGVDERTVRRHAQSMGLTENGKQTNLDEKAVTIIKAKIEKSGRSDLDNVVQLPNINTDLEMMIMESKVAEWRIRKIEELQSQLEQAKEKIFLDAPKVDSYNELQKSNISMSITQTSKYFGLHPKKQVFPYLRDCGYLTKLDLPTQSAIDAGYMVQRLSPCIDKVFRPQAVVLQKQLETWRNKVIPQIAAWEAKNK